MRVSTVIGAVALAGFAASLGFACGAALEPPRKLPRAGTPHDDGSGILARASDDATAMELFKLGVLSGGWPAGYGGSHVGESHATTYGGIVYGNYRFDWSNNRWRPLPKRRYARGYFGTGATRQGRIEGRVLWPAPPRAPSKLRPDETGCDREVENDTLRLGDNKQVAGAIVYLDSVLLGGRSGIADRDDNYGAQLQVGGSLRIEGCRLHPHVQIVAPVGATLRVRGADATPRKLTGLWNANVAFEVSIMRGHTRDVALGKPGIVEVVDANRSARAWVVVAASPYYTVTDESGAFRLDNIRPGHYTMIVWHPPVARRIDGQLTYTEPVVHKLQVHVKPGANRPLTVKLPALH